MSSTQTSAASEPDWDAAQFRVRVQQVLDEFLAEQARRLTPLGPDAAVLHAEATRAVSGGKRFRAAFCYWGYRAITPDPLTADDEISVLRACAALEILHASALAHDDLMDASDTRRGRPATHRAFEAAHRRAGWTGDPEQYGAAAAILLGDLLLSWADELLRRCGLAPTSVSPAMDLFDLCRSEVIAGQFLDVSVQARGVADVDTAMRVLRYKSAKYSVERPLHIGAALAGATEHNLKQLTAIGLPLGEAFQLRDDLLGVFGDPSVTGKPAGDDLVEGKRTVLVALALDSAVSTDKAGRADNALTGEAGFLDRSLGTALTPGDVTRLRQIIAASGARAQVEEAIAGLVATAETTMATADLTEDARVVLRSLAAAVTDRVE